MPKYHINKKGKVEECRATVRACPFGEENHIEADSPDEAVDKFDELHEGEENPTLAKTSVVNPNQEKVLQKFKDTCFEVKETWKNLREKKVDFQEYRKVTDKIREQMNDVFDTPQVVVHSPEWRYNKNYDRVKNTKLKVKTNDVKVYHYDANEDALEVKANLTQNLTHKGEKYDIEFELNHRLNYDIDTEEYSWKSKGIKIKNINGEEPKNHPTVNRKFMSNHNVQKIYDEIKIEVPLKK